MRKTFLLTAVLIALCGGARAQTVPSFDCARATAWADLILCKDSGLIRRDLDMAALLKDFYGRLNATDIASQRLAQAEWSSGRESCRTISAQDGISPRDCLIASYDRRIAEIRNKLAIVAPASAAAPPAPTKAPAAMASGAAPARPAVPPRDPNAVRFQQDPEERVENKPSAIQPGQPREKILVRESGEPVVETASDTMASCRRTTDAASCIGQTMQQADIDMQMQVSRLEMRLRAMDLDRPAVGGPVRFADSQKAFEAYRETHCRWKGALAGSEELYQSCRADLARTRSQEIGGILASMPQG